MPTDPIPILKVNFLALTPGLQCSTSELKSETTTSSKWRILAWRIPWTEEPSGLQFMESPRVRHDWETNTHIHTSSKRTEGCKQLKRCWMSLAIRERQIKAMMRYQHTPSRMGMIRILPIPSAAKNAERLYCCTSPAELQNGSTLNNILTTWPKNLTPTSLP